MPLPRIRNSCIPRASLILRTGLPADDDRFEFGQIAFEKLGILVVEQFADHGPQDGVAEEFQPFVGGQTVLCSRSMGQGGPKEALVTETVADRGVHRIPRRSTGRDPESIRHPMP